MISHIQAGLVAAAQREVSADEKKLRESKKRLAEIFDGKGLDRVEYTALIDRGRLIAIRSNEAHPSIESAIADVVKRFEDEHPDCHVRDCTVHAWAELHGLKIDVPQALFAHLLLQPAARAA